METKHTCCESCNADIEFYLIHEGFNDSAYSYCSSCGATLSVGLYEVQLKSREAMGKRLSEQALSDLPKCPCGGVWKRDAVPRCPHCKHEIRARQAASFSSLPLENWLRNDDFGPYSFNVPGRRYKLTQSGDLAHD